MAKTKLELYEQFQKRCEQYLAEGKRDQVDAKVDMALTDLNIELLKLEGYSFDEAMKIVFDKKNNKVGV